MTERPIMFQPDNVNAIREKRKSQTRRMLQAHNITDFTIISPVDDEWLIQRWPIQERSFGNFGRCERIKCPQGKVGDRLWVKEPWWCNPDIVAANKDIVWTEKALRALDRGPVFYKADGGKCPAGWRNPMFMPRWCCRLVIEITEVRAQRVQYISEADAIAEGIHKFKLPTGDIYGSDPRGTPSKLISDTAVGAYALLWDSINARKYGGAYAWDRNPWVWCITFKEVQQWSK